MSPSSGQSCNSSLPGSLDESPMKSKQNIQADPKVRAVSFFLSGDFLEVRSFGSWGCRNMLKTFHGEGVKVFF